MNKLFNFYLQNYIIVVSFERRILLIRSHMLYVYLMKLHILLFSYFLYLQN